MNLFHGKLTYTMAAVAVVVGIVGWITGVLEQTQALEMIWVGLTAFGLRRAVAK